MNPTMACRSSSSVARLAVVLVFLSSAGLVAPDLGLDSYGVSSDEQAYFDAAAAHIRWLPMALSREGYSAEILTEHFALNPWVVVHPALSRWLGGASWSIWHGLLDGDEVIGFRLAQAFVFATLCVLLFVEARRRWGVLPGFFAVALTWTSGRLFGHAHVMTTDLLLTTLWTSTALSLVRSRPLGGSRAVWLGLMLGASLSTKLTAVLLVAGVLAFLAVRDGRRALSSILVASIAAGLVVTALHPNGWLDPVASLKQTVSTFQEREDINIVPTLFFGTWYEHRVPPLVPTVHLLITFPTVHLILAVLGLAAAVPEIVAVFRATGSPTSRIRSLLTDSRVLLGGIAVLPLAAASLPAVPAHDLERLTLPIQPFLILIATFGAIVLARGLLAYLSFGPSEVQTFGMVAAAVLVIAGTAAVRAHPYELAWFNAFVGGPAGAHLAGFDVAYSKTELNGHALTAVRRFVKPGEMIYSHFSHLDLEEHQKHGRLSRDFEIVWPRRDAEWILIVGRRSWMNAFERFLYEETSPVWALRTYDGVTLVGLYHLDGKPVPGAPPPQGG